MLSVVVLSRPPLRVKFEFFAHLTSICHGFRAVVSATTTSRHPSSRRDQNAGRVQFERITTIDPERTLRVLGVPHRANEWSISVFDERHFVVQRHRRHQLLHLNVWRRIFYTILRPR